VAFSAIPRNAQPRCSFAGTYDERWRQDVFPLLPRDFDERYHQSAPEDQQVNYPVGGEKVALLNLAPDRPNISFRLPRLDNMATRILRTDYSTEMPVSVVDTIYFEPDEQRFSVVWRANVPIKRRIHEFDTVAVGPVNVHWWADKVNGGEGSCVGCWEPGETVAPRVSA